jgi:hypothetical protein
LNFGLLLLVVLGVEINNEGGESKMDINRPECSALEELPGGNCDKEKCHKLCIDLHDKGAWGECADSTECECHWFC